MDIIEPPIHQPLEGVYLLITNIPVRLTSPAIHFLIQVKYSEDRGISSDASSRLILYLGITTVLGRFGCGFLCSFKRLDNWYILQGVLLINGVSTTLLTLAQNYEALIAYAFIFGFCDGAMSTVFNIQALTCVDHSRVASAFGFTMVIGSVTSLVGPPLSGGTKHLVPRTF